jgi:hypothetical protein
MAMLGSTPSIAYVVFVAVDSDTQLPEIKKMIQGS